MTSHYQDSLQRGSFVVEDKAVEEYSKFFKLTMVGPWESPTTKFFEKKGWVFPKEKLGEIYKKKWWPVIKQFHPGLHNRATEILESEADCLARYTDFPWDLEKFLYTLGWDQEAKHTGGIVKIHFRAIVSLLKLLEPPPVIGQTDINAPKSRLQNPGERSIEF